MFCPYPLEYREGACLLPTDLLLQGKDPFDLSNNPQSTNIYGIFYNLLVFPLAKIWGPTLLLHRLVTGFFVLACCFIVVAVLRKNKLPWLLSLAGGMTLYPFLLFPATGTPLVGPQSLGMFLFLMTFFVPYFYNYSKTSLCISLFLGILAFYSKQYFLLGVPLTASYIFLFKSKNKGILYGTGFLFFFALSVVIANRVMNCYFNNVLFAPYNAVTNICGLTVANSISQLNNFYQLQKPLFFLIGIYFIVQGIVYIKDFKDISFKYFPKIDLFSWKEPLLKWDFDIALYGLIITSLTVYFILGRNNGNYMTYLFQLMSPFFILYIFTCLYRQLLVTFVGMILIIMTLFSLTSSYSRDFHELDENWKAVESLIATYPNIFASPLLVPLLVKYHRPVYDSGHSEYFHAGRDRKLLNIVFPDSPEIENRNMAHWQDVWDMVVHKKFDLLIILSDYHPFLPNMCALYYRPVAAVKLHNFFCAAQDYTYIILVPK